MTATRSLIGSVNSLSSAGQRYAKSLVDWSQEPGLVKGPAADELADVIDRLAGVEYLAAEVLQEYATALGQARTGLKDIREYEHQLNDKVCAFVYPLAAALVLLDELAAGCAKRLRMLTPRQRDKRAAIKKQLQPLLAKHKEGDATTGRKIETLQSELVRRRPS